MAVVEGSRKRVGDLPVDVTSFVGRRQEITEVKRLLSSSRLVTLTGSGGVGKTRLALRVVRDLSRSFQGRVWFVELAELREAALLANTVAERVGIHDQSARPPVEALIEFLRAKPGLVLLDNYEHLIDSCAELVATLLAACPELRVLATGRQALGLLGESVYTVPAFAVPDVRRVRSAEALTSYAAIRLFVERAQAVQISFRLDASNAKAVARVCHDLDGVPLAIELAAVRLRSLSVEQIAERLSERFRLLTTEARDVPARQRTLGALIDWSYDLCSDQERLVWARVSVFSGSFDLDAAEYVAAGGGLAVEEVLGVVGSLTDKSILLREGDAGGARYRMLETVREYGQARLAEAGEESAVRRHHRDWYEELAKRFAAEWLGPEQVAWVQRLRQEHANLRVALEFCASQPGEALAGLRMATQIDDYWLLRGFHAEARHWLERLLATVEQPIGERLSALRIGGRLALLQGDRQAGRAQLAEAIELAERLEDDTERAYLTLIRGMGALFTGDLPQAIALLGDALTRSRAAGLLRGELYALFLLGMALGLHGEREQGLALLEECLRTTSRLGETLWHSWALWSIAHVEVLYDDGLDRAETAGKQALSMQQSLDNRLAIAFNLDTLAWTAVRRHDHLRAATLFGTAHAAWQAIGSTPENYAVFARLHHEHVTQARDALAEHAFQAAFARGEQMSTDDAIEFAREARRPAPPASEGTEALLTRRERQIAELVAEGLSNRDIATSLVISQRTAEAHVEHILAKLGFTKRAQIAAWLTEQQLPAATATPPGDVEATAPREQAGGAPVRSAKERSRRRPRPQTR